MTELVTLSLLGVIGMLMPFAEKIRTGLLIMIAAAVVAVIISGS